VRDTESFVTRRPWATAALLGTVATPAAVVLGWLLPRPLDAVAALPLVLLDVWSVRAGRASPGDRLLLLALGIGLTWLQYVALARLALWRLLGPRERTPP
jgi:hypothetical protein